MQKKIIKNIRKLILSLIATSILVILIILFFPSSKFDLTKVNKEELLTGSMYKIFGMLDEYNGRFSLVGQPLPNFVESFGSGEKEIADLFDGCIQTFKKENKLDFKYVRTDSGFVFESKELSEFINAFYTLVDNIATLDSTILKKASMENKLNYIEGVYRRYGDAKKNSITMVNALEKLKTVAFVLKELKCSNIYIFRGEFTIPTSSKVIFIPGALVRERLQIQQIITESDLQKKGFSIFTKKIN